MKNIASAFERAMALLKTTLADWETTTDWVTEACIAQQFRAATGEGDSDKRGTTAITADEFQIFCQSIMNFIIHLGPAMERQSHHMGEHDAPPTGAYGALNAPGWMKPEEEEEEEGEAPAAADAAGGSGTASTEVEAVGGKGGGCGCFFR